MHEGGVLILIVCPGNFRPVTKFEWMRCFTFCIFQASHAAEEEGFKVS